ncbi:MAG: DUF6531 domain-containing protein, partial [Acidobacteriota bacterium]
ESAVHGTTVLSALLTDLPQGSANALPGQPQRVAVAGWNARQAWTLGEVVPTGLATTPATMPALAEIELVIAGAGPREGAAVSVFNRTRGRMERTAVGADGSWQVTIDAQRGDTVEVLREEATVTYAATFGVGVAATDLFKNLDVASPSTDIKLSLTNRFPAFDGNLLDPGCNPQVAGNSQDAWDVAVLPPAAEGGDPVLVTLMRTYGVGLWQVSRNQPRHPTAIRALCGRAGGEAPRMTGLAVVADYPMARPDGTVEERDFVLATHAGGHLVIWDVTDPYAPQGVADIQLAPQVTTADLVVDRTHRRIVVSALGAGVYFVDFDRLPSVFSLDEDGDGVDDRVLDVVQLPGRNPWRIEVDPLTGVVATTSQHHVSTVSTTLPSFELVAAQGASAGEPVTQLAPFGVAVAETQPGDATTPTAVVRARGAMPNLSTTATLSPPTLRLEMVAEASGGGEISGLGDLADAPRTRLSLDLERQADRPWEDGYRLYRSEPVVLVADPRASIAFTREAEELEGDLCVARCDQVGDDGAYLVEPTPAARYSELLSGDRVALYLGAAEQAQVAEAFPLLNAALALKRVESVRWDVGPSWFQEPDLNPSFGAGDVAPGTLLHSGEFTHATTDVALPDLGTPLAMTRTYRSGAVGWGPLGPGWDFGYRMRLRPHLDGTVDFYDGTGRRVRFSGPKVEATGVQEGPPGLLANLKKFDGAWVLAWADGTEALFDASGRLTSLRDVFKRTPTTGNETFLRYDAHGRLSRVDGVTGSLDFGYDDSAQRLTSVEDSTGRRWTYGYDSAGRLESVTSPEVQRTVDGPTQSLTTRYGYASAPTGSLAERLHGLDELERLDDATGATWLTLGWGGTPARRQVTAQTWGGTTLSIAYSGATTTVTDRRGGARAYEHTASGHLRVFEDAEIAGDRAATTWTYDAYAGGREHGLVKRVAPPNGTTIEHDYLPSNESSQVALALANVTETTIEPHAGASALGVGAGFCSLDAAGGAPSELVWTFEAHQARTQIPRLTTLPTGTEVDHRFDDQTGVPEATIFAADSPTPISSEVTRDDRGRPTQRTLSGPGGPVSRQGMDYGPPAEGPPRVLPRAIQFGEGDASAESTVETSALHLPIALGGDATPAQRMAHNALGWPLETCTGAQQAITCTRVEYDGAGRVTRTEVRDGAGTVEAATETEYDVLGMPTRIRTWVEGETWLEETRTYDANRNLIAVDAPNRAPVTMTYDGRNRLTSTTTADGTETYAYTPSGKLKSRTDRNGETWTTEFDAYERPAILRDPDGHFGLTERDALGRVVRTAACQSDGTLLAQTFYEYDALNRVIAERQWLAPADDPENGTSLETRAEYDAAGRVTKVVTPEGDETTHLYDLLGRPWSTEHAKNGTTSLAISRLFDPRGNVLEETHTGTDGSFTTGYAYDA